MRIFISHSSTDASVALEICSLIEANQSTCFIAPRDIRSGKEYAEEIMNGINSADAMVLVMSENANKSPHVLREVERAVSRSIPILVFKLEDVELTKSMEYFLMTHQWVSSEKKRDYSEILKFVHEFEEKENKLPNIELNTVASLSPKKSKKKYLYVSVLLLLLIVGMTFVFMHKPTEYHPGDVITFGTYNNEPIEWYVLKLSENKKEAVIIAKDILTMKAYDAAEGGKFNSDGINNYWSENTAADTDLMLQIRMRGNNDWKTSNIRTWLNSEEQVVTYKDQAPTPAAMSESYNGYHHEPGFLSNFSNDEISAIITTEIKTNGNALADDEVIVTNDRVFLLSGEELQWFEDAGLSVLASPTAAAVEQDMSYWYDIDVQELQTNNFYWWLREPLDGTSSKCYMVSNGYTEELLTSANVGTEGFGIRPAIVIDLTSSCFK